MSDPLRVGLLSPYFWPEVRRGSECHVHDLAAGLPPRGIEPTVITSHLRRRRREPELYGHLHTHRIGAASDYYLEGVAVERLRRQRSDAAWATVDGR